MEHQDGMSFTLVVVIGLDSIDVDRAPYLGVLLHGTVLHEQARHGAHGFKKRTGLSDAVWPASPARQHQGTASAHAPVAGRENQKSTFSVL
ncbi:hypothetical protein [Thauera butanivorans]|uniref:hypothetical protein n=1 Tax=Thauera butanivorans TaxID=86174 RepID=UPI0014720FF1|nr:hypothetical protein [Thauera butanivorans]